MMFQEALFFNSQVKLKATGSMSEMDVVESIFFGG